MSLTLAQRQALRRGADPGRVLGAAAGGALAAAGIGYAAELGAVTLNPALVIPGLVLLIGELTGLIPSFAGKPKLLDTVQAVKRLAQSSNPAFQQLAANIAIYAKNGVPISTSNPQQQSQLRSWIGGAIATALAQAGLPTSGRNVSILDSAVRNVLESEVANSGRKLDATLMQLGAGGREVAPTPSLSLRRGGLQPGRTVPGPRQPAPVSAQQDTTQSLPLEVLKWIAQHGLLGGLPTLSLEAARQLGHCVLDFIRGHEFLAAECIADLAARQTGQAARDFLTGVRQLFTGGKNQPAGLPQLQPQPGQPQPAPYLDRTQPCESCGGRKPSPLENELRAQESRTLQDIRREQEQLTEEQLTQQSKELSHLEELEGQPAGQRDIPHELQQKQKLLEQIRNEEYQLGSQPAGQPLPPGEQAPLLKRQPSDEVARELEHEHKQTEAHEAVQFCVGCTNQEQAILFLNGESAECSVIPGSTRAIPVQPPNQAG